MRTILRWTLVTAVVLSPLGLTACDQLDPLTKPYMWKPTQANTRNIAAMAVNPADLTVGRSSKRHRVVMESEAVERAWAGKPTPLLGGGAAGSGGGGGSPGGSTPPAGGGP